MCCPLWIKCSFKGYHIEDEEHHIDNEECHIEHGVSFIDTGNECIETYTRKEYAYFQAQRCWVERNFDDGKNQLGLSDYQIRKWKGWHHHHAIVFMQCYLC